MPGAIKVIFSSVLTYDSGSCPRGGMPLGRALNIVSAFLTLNCY